MGFFDALSRGLERSREALNEVFYFGGEVDEDFWEDLEDTLVMGDMGAEVAIKVSDDLRDAAAKRTSRPPAAPSRPGRAARATFVPAERDPFADTPSCVLFVGINGAGKTTTVGKIASAMAARGKNVVIGSADTFRAAAIEQLDVWGQRAGVPVIKRDRGSDPASVATTCSTRADKRGSDRCSSIPPAVCIRAPSSCASLPRWSTLRVGAPPIWPPAPCPSQLSS